MSNPNATQTPDYAAWWKAQHERVLHSDQIAARLGSDALKTLILMNAGAVVALIAFAGQVWRTGDTEIIHKAMLAGRPFLWGVLFGVLAFPFAYFYQSAVTHLTFLSLDLRNSNNRPKWIVIIESTSRILMLVFALASLAAFIIAAIKVMNVFSH